MITKIREFFNGVSGENGKNVIKYFCLQQQTYIIFIKTGVLIYMGYERLEKEFNRSGKGRAGKARISERDDPAFIIRSVH